MIDRTELFFVFILHQHHASLQRSLKPACKRENIFRCAKFVALRVWWAIYTGALSLFCCYSYRVVSSVWVIWTMLLCTTKLSELDIQEKGDFELNDLTENTQRRLTRVCKGVLHQHSELCSELHTPSGSELGLCVCVCTHTGEITTTTGKVSISIICNPHTLSPQPHWMTCLCGGGCVSISICEEFNVKQNAIKPHFLCNNPQHFSHKPTQSPSMYTQEHFPNTFPRRKHFCCERLYGPPPQKTGRLKQITHLHKHTLSALTGKVLNSYFLSHTRKKRFSKWLNQFSQTDI